jgi:Raf kinase inhibitor-like YbhB/YbcL family protein
MPAAIPAIRRMANWEGRMILKLTIAGFDDGGEIPVTFTCDGQDKSPPLEWSDAPAGTQSFALIVDDPDAPRATWVHWLIYQVPSTQHRLDEGVPAVRELPTGARQGQNDFRKIGYGGPCPPRGPVHRYYFRLYALDAKLDLRAGVKRGELERAMTGHILAQAEVMGRYGR